MSIKRTAYHEAGHAAADLILGHGCISATIVPTPRDHIVGAAQQLYSDDLTVEGMEDMVISLYAGGEGDRLVTPGYDHATSGAWDDDEKAEGYLARLNTTEDDLRKRAAKRLSDNWGLVELIASELLLHKTLVSDELGLMLDIHQGDTTINDLEQFRVTFLRR